MQRLQLLRSFLSHFLGFRAGWWVGFVCMHGCMPVTRLCNIVVKLDMTLICGQAFSWQYADSMRAHNGLPRLLCCFVGPLQEFPYTQHFGHTCCALILVGVVSIGVHIVGACLAAQMASAELTACCQHCRLLLLFCCCRPFLSLSMPCCLCLLCGFAASTLPSSQHA